MDLQETAANRIAKVAGKYKAHAAVGAAGAAAGAYAANRARKKFNRAVDREVHMRKARYAQLREMRMSSPQLRLLTGAKTREAKMRAVANDPKAIKQYSRSLRWGKAKYRAGRIVRGAATGALVGGAALRTAGSQGLGGGWKTSSSQDKVRAMKGVMGVGAAVGGGVGAVHGGSAWKHARIHSKAVDKAYSRKLARDYKANTNKKMNALKETDRERLLQALLKEMAPAINVAKAGTPATQAAREIMRSRRAKGGALAVGALGAGALAMRARAKRRQEEGHLSELSMADAVDAAKYVSRNAKTSSGRYSLRYSAGRHLAKHKGKYGAAAGGAAVGMAAIRARVKRRQQEKGK